MHYTYTVTLMRYTPNVKFPETAAHIRMTGMSAEREFLEDLNHLIESYQTDLTNAKPLIVDSVDEVKLARFIEETADRVPVNGKYAQKVIPGQLFSSATELSLRLGAGRNECSQQLSLNRRRNPPQVSATVRGVTFRLVENL